MRYPTKQHRAFTTDHNTVALRIITKQRPCSTTLNDTNTRRHETMNYLAIPMHYLRNSAQYRTFAVLDQTQQNYSDTKRDITTTAQHATSLFAAVPNHTKPLRNIAVLSHYCTMPHQALPNKTLPLHHGKRGRRAQRRPL